MLAGESPVWEGETRLYPIFSLGFMEVTTWIKRR